MLLQNYQIRMVDDVKNLKKLKKLLNYKNL